MHDEAAALLNWYDEHKRSLPWRDIHDPYATWVSEVMLQQTRVETVLRYYPRFMQRFPNVQTLAEAPIDDVLKMWEGLGYYRRARNLHAGACQVAAEFGGVLPCDLKQLRSIRGIGDYTAGAILSIAYEQPVAAVDGNAVRVISRLCGIRENAGMPSTMRKITQMATELQVSERPGDFNQALMDLGARICTPGTPDCEHCPLAALCDAHESGDEDSLPMLPDKKQPVEENYAICIVVAAEGVLMRQRTETMLQGLWVFPMVSDADDHADLIRKLYTETGVNADGCKYLCDAKHVFTHRIWNMKVYTMQADQAAAKPGWKWMSIQDMDNVSIPTAMRIPVKHARDILKKQ